MTYAQFDACSDRYSEKWQHSNLQRPYEHHSSPFWTSFDCFLPYISYSPLVFIYAWRSSRTASFWHLFVGLEWCKATAHLGFWIRLSLRLSSWPSGLFHTECISSKAVLQRNCRQVQVVISHWQPFCCITEIGLDSFSDLLLVFTSITDMHLKIVNWNDQVRNITSWSILLDHLMYSATVVI